MLTASGALGGSDPPARRGSPALRRRLDAAGLGALELRAFGFEALDLARPARLCSPPLGRASLVFSLLIAFCTIMRVAGITAKDALNIQF